MKRPYKTLLIILAAVAIDALFYFCLLWVLRTVAAALCLLAGLVAKEAVVSSLCLLYGFSTLDAGSTIAAALSSTFHTPVAAYAYLVFILLYVPCVAAVSTLWQLCAAWLVSFVVFQVGSLLF